MRWPRTLAKLYADLCGYFWLPCPVCGQMFGGHEILSRKGGRVDLGRGRGVCTCPDCPGDWTVEQAAHIDEHPWALGALGELRERGRH